MRPKIMLLGHLQQTLGSWSRRRWATLAALLFRAHAITGVRAAAAGAGRRVAGAAVALSARVASAAVVASSTVRAAAIAAARIGSALSRRTRDGFAIVRAAQHAWTASRSRRLASQIAFWLFAVTALQAVMVVSTRAALYDNDDYLLYPDHWLASLDLRAPVRPLAVRDATVRAVGGMNVAPLPLVITEYRVKRGDTLSSIADDFGLELDTIASLNRAAGVGVHMVEIAEMVSVPNQDGIFLPAGADLELTSLEHGLLADTVLATNQARADDVEADTRLFFPGVQHSGAALTLAIGAAFQRPLSGGWVSSPYGPRVDPFTSARRMHNGIDLAARRGLHVGAAQDGRVVAVGVSPQLGNYVIISHYIERYSSIYGHLERIHTRRGQVVARGQLIGTVGSTGRSTAPHLHFELRQGHRPVNPADLIARMR